MTEDFHFDPERVANLACSKSLNAPGLRPPRQCGQLSSLGFIRQGLKTPDWRFLEPRARHLPRCLIRRRHLKPAWPPIKNQHLMRDAVAGLQRDIRFFRGY